jgi:hypothetical protein
MSGTSCESPLDVGTTPRRQGGTVRGPRAAALYPGVHPTRQPAHAGRVADSSIGDDLWQPPPSRNQHAGHRLPSPTRDCTGRRSTSGPAGYVLCCIRPTKPQVNWPNFVALNISHDAWLRHAGTGQLDSRQRRRCSRPNTGGPVERYDHIRRCAAGAPPIGAPHAGHGADQPVPARRGDHERLLLDVFGVSRATPYLAQEIMRAMAAIPGFASASLPDSP